MIPDPERDLTGIESELYSIGKSFGIDTSNWILVPYSRKNLIYEEMKRLVDSKETDYLVKLPPIAQVRERRNPTSSVTYFHFPIDLPELVRKGLFAHELSDYSLSKNPLFWPFLFLRDEYIKNFLARIKSDVPDKIFEDIIDFCADLKARKMGYGKVLDLYYEYKPNIQKEDRKMIHKAIKDGLEIDNIEKQ